MHKNALSREREIKSQRSITNAREERKHAVHDRELLVVAEEEASY
jgi:hypothetical protein